MRFQRNSPNIDEFRRIVEDPAWREKMITSGNIYLQRFQENILADSMSKVYSKCFEGAESATISQQDIQVEDYRMNWSKRPL